MIVKEKLNLSIMVPRISMKIKQDLSVKRIDQLELENAQLHALLQKQIDINHSKTVFLAKVSHDLRSPLTNIQLSASLIEHYYKYMNEEKIFGHLGKIKDAVSNFVVILNNYLLNEQDQKVDEDQFTG
ncbi:signal transduction histidine kinase [Mucilaginibacter sp. UYNi724]